MVADSETASCCKYPIRDAVLMVKEGLSYNFPIDLQRLSQCAPRHFFGEHWRRLDRYGLGLEGPFWSMISRRLRMRPERTKSQALNGKNRVDQQRAGGNPECMMKRIRPLMNDMATTTKIEQ